ncbi:Glyco_tranf_GTA_type domain containing protein [uncultured Caudovirales phage]|uniref:Glyco_tranf_GTA_type domain containing protein n=1 Tax=uncultured Caudovirales phage TaxID=2100421 RepID=A0A6J5MQ05_9CAUD|nr:Glyco_tranf_GTA_type domain containing protein [uncultured Caudovirales phage]
MAMKMCVVVPSRGRPENAERLAQAFKDTNTEADLYVIIDNDDPKWDEYAKSQNYKKLPADNKTGGCAKSLNTGAVHLLDITKYPLYDYFVFMGDDHLPRTQGWDKAFIQALGQNTGIVYGDDLLQGSNLPTAFGMSRDLVNELQGMTFPGCIHLFFDNFVKQLGLDLEYLKYLPDVIIEHLHPIAGKAEMDEGYARVNQPKWYEQDLLTLQRYFASAEYAGLVRKYR